MASIVKRITSITAARSVSIVSALLVSMVLARIISVQALGEYKTVWILYGVLGPIFTSSLTGLLYYRGANKENVSEVIVSGLIWSSLAGLFMFLVTWFGFPLWEYLFHADGQIIAFRNFAIYLFFSGFTSPIEAIFILKRRNKWLFAHNVISNLIEFSCVVVPYSLGYDIEVVTRWLIVAPYLRASFLILFTWHDWNQIKWSTFFNGFKSDGNYVLGLAVVALAGIVSVQIDSWFVRWFYEDTALFAEYVIGARKIPFLSALLSSVSAALILQIGKQLRERKFGEVFAQINPLASTLFSLLLPFLVLFLVFAKEIMLLLFGGFEASAPVFQIYIGTVLVHFLFPDTILLAMGKSSRVIQASLIEIVFNVVLSISFLYWIGFTGPAWATLISHVIYIWVCMIFVRAETGESASLSNYISFRKCGLGITISAIVLLAFYLISFVSPISIPIFIAFSVVLTVLQAIVFKSDIRQVLKKLKTTDEIQA